MVRGFLGPVRKLEVQMIFSRRKGHSALITKDSVLNLFESGFRNGIREFFLLREDGPVVFPEHDYTHFDGIAVPPVRLRGHAQIPWMVKANRVVQSCKSARIAGRERDRKRSCRERV